MSYTALGCWSDRPGRTCKACSCSLLLLQVLCRYVRLQALGGIARCYKPPTALQPLINVLQNRLPSLCCQSLRIILSRASQLFAKRNLFLLTTARWSLPNQAPSPQISLAVGVYFHLGQGCPWKAFVVQSILMESAHVSTCGLYYTPTHRDAFRVLVEHLIRIRSFLSRTDQQSDQFV